MEYPFFILWGVPVVYGISFEKLGDEGEVVEEEGISLKV